MPPKAKHEAAPATPAPEASAAPAAPVAPPDQGRPLQEAPAPAAPLNVTPAAFTLIIRESLTINLPGGKVAKVARGVCPEVTGAGLLSVLSAAQPGDMIRVAVSLE